MYLLVDVVASEMAVDIGDHNMTAGTKIDYSAFSPAPFNDEASYNSYCPIVDWQNVTEYQNCWLGYTGVATPDIKTENKDIAAALGTWIKELVANYSIDGIRIDGAKQITYDFFQDFVDASGVYPLGEVDDGDAAFTCNYQQYTEGLENYPVYFTTIQAFTAGKMSGLVDMVKSVGALCKSPQYLANFIENQDQPRFASYNDDETVSFFHSSSYTEILIQNSSQPTQWPSQSSQTVSPSTTMDKNNISKATIRHTTVKLSGKVNQAQLLLSTL